MLVTGRSGRFCVGPGEDLVDVVHQLRKGLGLAVARLRQLHRKVGADMAGIAPQHDDAVGQQHGFFNVVCDEEDGLGGHGLLRPQLQQFAAQVLGGQHVERGKRLVHEENFRLDHQGAGKTHALPHAAGELLGIGRFKTVQADHVEHLHAAFAALRGCHAARLQRRLNVLKYREPGKQRETLEDDRDIDLGLSDGRAVPVNLARRWRGEPGQHAQHGRLARSGGPQQGKNLAGNNAQVGRRDHLNAILARLRVVLLDPHGANDRVIARLRGRRGVEGLVRADRFRHFRFSSGELLAGSRPAAASIWMKN